MPAVKNAATAGKIVVIRGGDRHALGEGYPVTIDGNTVFGIGMNEYGEVDVNPGRHTVASKCYASGIIFKEIPLLEVSTKTGETTYVELRSESEAPRSCMQIIKLEEQAAKDLLDKAKKIDLTADEEK